jgi:FtsH-binding integral membrane protein
MEYAAPRPQLGVEALHLQGFLRRVFAWMFLGLLVTAGVAGAVGSSDRLLTDLTANPGVFIGIVVAELAIVVGLTFFINRISAAVATGLFFVYAALNGFVFALIFELYTKQSIFTAFLVTAGMFGALAWWGYATKRDLSAWGSILFMGLVGLILATIANVFIANSTLYWVTTYAGVLIFCGLTAYDMQKLRRYAEAGGASEEAESKAAVQGALALYLDFVNLFLYLLRIFGSRR